MGHRPGKGDGDEAKEDDQPLGACRDDVRRSRQDGRRKQARGGSEDNDHVDERAPWILRARTAAGDDRIGRSDEDPREREQDDAGEVPSHERCGHGGKASPGHDARHRTERERDAHA